ncbi:Rho termination factor N-terminal domain-containing protein [Clostridium tyrobutyricum]|uniref:Rho termination factor N-terminal domain-containing protein n=1 Tax=Clostridium tyrobutyricum TaxID=1519 RepID=UPI0010AA6467|nr:Rho termination factor N-terminal domain-containing protein [Clostridium tyrobutyricum]QCH29258.1 hypothetical protein EZN00_02891 [Clostridium tyrobutyricum]
MFKLKRLNVVRIVSSESEKTSLEAQGFKEAPEVAINYNNYTLDDLKQLAKDKGIQGYSNMKKEDLVTAIKTLEGEKK